MTAPAESVQAGAGSTPSSANTLPPWLDHIPRPLRKRNPFPPPRYDDSREFPRHRHRRRNDHP
jgi:hypothetical protein